MSCQPKESKTEEPKNMDYKKILENEEVKAFLKKGNENLGVLGYTDHSEKHCAIVAKRAGEILKELVIQSMRLNWHRLPVPCMISAMP